MLHHNVCVSLALRCTTVSSTDVPRSVPLRVRVSSVTDAPHVLSYGYHPYCPTDFTHTVLRMSYLRMSPILSYVYHPYWPTDVTHTILRISPILFYGCPTYTGYGCHPYCLTDVPPILSYGCPTYAVLRMSPMLSQLMSGSLALRMSQPYRPTGVIHTVSR